MHNPLKRLVAVALVTATLFCTGAALAAAPVSFVCSGPKVAAARQVAKDNHLTLGMDAKACFGEMQLTESARKLLNVYDRSRAGSWYALFTQPVCGTAIAVGPKSPYGDTMITIDGRHCIDKAGAFVPFQ